MKLHVNSKDFALCINDIFPIVKRGAKTHKGTSVTQIRVSPKGLEFLVTDTYVFLQSIVESPDTGLYEESDFPEYGLVSFEDVESMKKIAKDVSYLSITDDKLALFDSGAEDAVAIMTAAVTQEHRDDYFSALINMMDKTLKSKKSVNIHNDNLLTYEISRFSHIKDVSLMPMSLDNKTVPGVILDRSGKRKYTGIIMPTAIN